MGVGFDGYGEGWKKLCMYSDEQREDEERVHFAFTVNL